MYLASFESDNLTAGNPQDSLGGRGFGLENVLQDFVGGRGFGFGCVQDFIGSHYVFTGKNVILKTHFFHVRYSFLVVNSTFVSNAFAVDSLSFQPQISIRSKAKSITN